MNARLASTYKRNDDRTKLVLSISAAAGSRVELSAAGSTDPDDDGLGYSWSFYDEASSHNGSVTIEKGSSQTATVQVPPGASGKTLHVILELTDNGSPKLYAYRRVIINVH